MMSFPRPPTSNIDWTSLEDIQFQEVNGHVESTWNKSTNRWTPLKFVSDPCLRIHGLSPGLNYGQHAFEGLKAFRMAGTPSRITIFRPDRHAFRLQHSANVIDLPAVPKEMFVQACRAAVALNAEYVPPHESGCAMYIRPLLFTSGPMFIPSSPDSCTFCVYVFPTSSGVPPTKPVKALILDEFDRAAPRGVGHAKVGGNYAGVVRWTGQAKSQGFGITLHLDSAKHEEVDEFSSYGFLGVLCPREDISDVTIVVPDSPCAIKSVTSDSVQHLARSWGWKVEKRPVPYTELPNFSEVIGAGTAVGLVAIRSITRKGIESRAALPPHARVLSNSEDSEMVVYMSDDQRAGGPICLKLIEALRDVQFGKVADDFGWCYEIQANDTIGECCNGDTATLAHMPII
ncbi:branched-chain amino acid aminotransferase [Cadophora sp. MPI-SDFR-AT-0126]|nr:branched-chain amino acid aminotransferase [Leotiomycetes sp. MPI-SDFR-AT-0126]